MHVPWFLGEPNTRGAASIRHAPSRYVIRVPRRNELQGFPKAKGIGTEVFYPLHLQECFAHVECSPWDFPESAKVANEALALPIYSELSHEQAAHVEDCIADFPMKPASRPAPTGRI